MKKTIIGMILACMTLFVGCDWFNKTVNTVNAETYVKYAGKAVAMAVQAGDYFAKDKDVKSVVLTTIDDVVAKLPKNIACSNVVSNIEEIAITKVKTLDIDESKKAIYSTVVKGIYAMFGEIINLSAAKYATEFATAEKTYALIVEFLNSVKSSLNETILSAPANNIDFDIVKKEVFKTLKIELPTNAATNTVEIKK